MAGLIVNPRRAVAAVGGSSAGPGATAPSRPALRFALPLGFWALFGMLVGVQTYLGMLSHHHSLARLAAYSMLVFLYWAPATSLIAWLAHRFPTVPWRWRSLAAHGGAAVVLSVADIAWAAWLALVMRPFDTRSYTQFVPGFMGSFASQFLMELLIYAGILATLEAFDHYRRSRERALRTAELERELARARLAALSAQLQPHFLFNALHTVSGLIRGQESQAAIGTLTGLSDILRYALDESGGPEAALEAELDVTRRFLEIQRLRRGDRLRIEFDIAPEALGAAVPRLLLQPLVENAIRHGVTASDPPWLRLRAKRAGERLRIEVVNGAGGETNGSGGMGIGLANTRERLAQLFGPASTLTAGRVADRFEVIVELPWRRPGEPGPTRG